MRNRVGKTRAHYYGNILTVAGSRKALGEASLGTAPVPSTSTRTLRSSFFPTALLQGPPPFSSRAQDCQLLEKGTNNE